MAKAKNNLVPGQESHDKLLENIVNRLFEKDKYDIILKNINYQVKGCYNKTYIGEIDILARNKKDLSWLFVEVKSNPYGDKNRARRQYKRFCYAYPCMNQTGILVYPDIEKGLDYLHCKRFKNPFALNDSPSYLPSKTMTISPFLG